MEMTMSKKNPYIGRGVPVSGERLVGRNRLLDRLVERAITDAHCSIVGLPRLGKTSVAKEVLRKCNVLQSDLATGYVTLDAMSGPAHVYARILDEITGEQTIKSDQSHDNAYDQFLRTLRRRKKVGQRGLVVIDEVDGIVRSDFVDAPLFISRLREMANEQDRYGLTFIFVSRRSLDMIQGAVDCSTLAGLCEVVYMQPLDRDGLAFLKGRSLLPVEEGAFSLLWDFTGGHPFLAEVVMCEAMETANTRINEDSIEDAQHIQAHEFTNQYRQLQGLLSDESMFDSLSELVVGPRWRPINAHVVSLLKNYGLIRATNQTEGNIDCMSEHLKEYLIQHTRMTPTWALIGETEKQLRNLVLDRMNESFGLDWINKVKTTYPKLTNRDGVHLVDRLISQRLREKKLFGDAASDYILDYAYFSDLNDLVFVDWDRYRSVLCGTKDEWKKRFQDVMKVTKPHGSSSACASEYPSKRGEIVQCFFRALSWNLSRKWLKLIEYFIQRRKV